MHMEALDRSFSSGSHTDGGLSLSSYPLTPEPQLNGLTQYSECLQPQYSPIQYNDNYQYGSQTSLEPSSPIASSIPTPLDMPLHSYSRTPLTSMLSYSSDSSSSSYPLSSSQSSGLSEMPSISNMSISSDMSSSTSLFSADSPSPLYNHNPFSVPSSRTNLPHSIQPTRKSATTRQPLRSSQDSSVPRRSSAPARGTTVAPSTRKDSFVYDVQLESDNVLLFVPDLDLVKSHLMFAVREEVDVLKERIGELMERINHLEYENTVLRKYATQEALQQLQHHNPNP